LIALVPEVLNTTESALKLSLEDRDCYQDSEFGFTSMVWDGGFKYSMKNCLYESVLEKIVENCTCKPVFVNFKLKGDDYEFCQGLELACQQYWMNQFGSESDPVLNFAWNNQSEHLKCRQRCETQTNNLVSTVSTYPNIQVLPYREDYCIILTKLHRSCDNPYKSDLIQARYGMLTACDDIKTMIEDNNVCDINNPINPPQTEIDDETMNNFVHKYAMENVAVIKLFVKDPYYTNNKRDVAITITTFIGNAGGLMGLCLGLSFISLFEVVYHFFFACLRTLFNGNSKTQKQKSMN